MPIANASKQLILGTVNANSKFRSPIPTSKRTVSLIPKNGGGMERHESLLRSYGAGLLVSDQFGQ